MSKRALANWLDAYTEMMDQNESPPRYHRWAGLSALAAVVRRNVVTDFDYFRHYPNMYIVLAGPPAIKKTSAMNQAKRMVRQALPKIRFANDSTTREALIDGLASAYDGDLGYSALTAHSPEFGNMLQSSQHAMIDFLTGIYDYDLEDFIHGTVGRGEVKIVRPFLNLLACTTPEFVHRNLPSYAIGTGFISRVVFVYEDRIGKLVPRPQWTATERRLYPALVADLERIATIKGRFTFAGGAGEWYDDWYCGRREELERADRRLAGFFARKPVHLIKLAMLLSIARKDELVLETDDLRLALDMLTELEPGMHRLFSGVGRNIFAPIGHNILEMLVNHGDTMKKQALLNAMIGDVSLTELEETLNTIREAGWVSVRRGQTTMQDEWFATPAGMAHIRGKEQKNGH